MQQWSKKQIQCEKLLDTKQKKLYHSMRPCVPHFDCCIQSLSSHSRKVTVKTEKVQRKIRKMTMVMEQFPYKERLGKTMTLKLGEKVTEQVYNKALLNNTENINWDLLFSMSYNARTRIYLIEL